MSLDLTPQPGQAGQVRALLGLIAAMTLAIAFILGMFVGRLMAPAGARPPPATIDFASAPEIEIGLPAGARVTAAHVEAGRLTLEIVTAQGDEGVYTAPLAGLEGAVRLRYVAPE